MKDLENGYFMVPIFKRHLTGIWGFVCSRSARVAMSGRVNAKRYVVAIQENTSRCRAALQDLARDPPSSSLRLDGPRVMKCRIQFSKDGESKTRSEPDLLNRAEQVG